VVANVGGEVENTVRTERGIDLECEMKNTFPSLRLCLPSPTLTHLHRHSLARSLPLAVVDG